MVATSAPEISVPTGSGSVTISADPALDPSINKQKIRKTLISNILWLLNNLLYLKIDGMYLQEEVGNKKNFKATEEKCRIRIRIKASQIRNIVGDIPPIRTLPIKGKLKELSLCVWDWPAGVVSWAEVGKGGVGGLLPRTLVHVGRPVHALPVRERGQVRVPKQNVAYRIHRIYQRVSDPDWIRIQSGQWIRIRIHESENDPQK